MRISESLIRKWKGDPRNFLESCDYSAPVILLRLRGDKHKRKDDFPSLRNSKIGPLWLRMLRDNANLSSIQDLDKVPIPVDIHFARASVSLGVIKSEHLELDGIFPEIRRVWELGVKGHVINGKEMLALDIHEPLCLLSKYGCTNLEKESGNCPMARECPVVKWCVYTS